MARRRALAALALAVATILAACGSSGDDPDDSEILVFAASSLTEAFKELGTTFEQENPGTKVTFNFAASSALATQINEAAPADVFASADAAQMKVVTDKGNAAGPVIFAKNSPVVVVPKGRSGVAAFADLAKPGLRLVLAAKEVPIGRYSREILTNASATGGVSADFSDNVLANLKSDEANVRAVLTKVQLGEADAGIVYKTDVAAAAGEVAVVEIPAAYNVVAEYPIAVTKQTQNRASADAFVAFVRSAEGVAILEKYGFAKP